MVTIKINAVMFDTEYEFSLDSNTPIMELTEEIGEMICQKEQCLLSGKIEQLMLFSKEKGYVLSPDSTLNDYGIKTGDLLYFG